MAKAVDKRVFEIQDSSDKLRFMRARDGDNLVMPFQCDLPLQEPRGKGPFAWPSPRCMDIETDKEKYLGCLVVLRTN